MMVMMFVSMTGRRLELFPPMSNGKVILGMENRTYKVADSHWLVGISEHAAGNIPYVG